MRPDRALGDIQAEIAAQIEAARREKEQRWENATPAERLAIQKEDAAREEAAARAVAEAKRNADARDAATTAARKAEKSAEEQALIWNVLIAILAVAVGLMIWLFEDDGMLFKDDGISYPRHLGRTCRKFAGILGRVVVQKVGPRVRDHGEGTDTSELALHPSENDDHLMADDPPQEARTIRLRIILENPRYILAAVGSLITLQGIIFRIIDPLPISTVTMSVGIAVVLAGLHVEIRQALNKLLCKR